MIIHSKREIKFLIYSRILRRYSQPFNIPLDIPLFLTLKVENIRIKGFFFSVKCNNPYNRTEKNRVKFFISLI